MTVNKFKFWKIMSSSFGLIWLLLFISLPPPALSQTYTLGYTLYTKGDFKGAIGAFRKTLNRNRPSNQEERAQLFKYMGISHFMLGEKRDATRSFSAGLRLNSELSIDPKEVLDETVISFFQQVVKRVNSAKSSNFAEENNISLPAPSGTVATVTIQSNAENAEVLIDGKVVGRANRAFDAKPGVTEVEVQAKGYESKKVRLSIKTRQSHNFEVKLRRQVSPPPSRTKPPADSSLAAGRPKRVVLPQEQEIDSTAITESKSLPSNEKRSPPSEIPLPISAPPVSEQSSPTADSSNQPFSFLSLLPFGIGQFNNGQYLLGTAFAISEVALLGFYYQSTLEEDFARTRGKEFIERESREGSISIEALEQYRVDVNRVIQGEQQKQQLFLTGFGVLWVTEIAHAIITAPRQETVSYRNPDYHAPNLIQQRQTKTVARIGISPTRQGWSLQVALLF